TGADAPLFAQRLKHCIADIIRPAGKIGPAVLSAIAILLRKIKLATVLIDGKEGIRETACVRHATITIDDAGIERVEAIADRKPRHALRQTITEKRCCVREHSFV